MKTIKGTIKADGTQVNIKVVGFYSHITGQTHKTKSCRTKAENKLHKAQLDQKKQQLVNKYNN